MVGRLLRNTIYTFTLSLLVAFAVYLVLGNYAPDRLGKSIGVLSHLVLAQSGKHVSAAKCIMMYYGNKL